MRGLSLRNRIFLSGHSTNFAEDNLPTVRHKNHYVERARGGVALVVTEAIRVHPTACDHGALLSGYNPLFSERFRPILEAVRAEGARVFAQLVHPGRHGGGSRLWAPSALAWGPGAPIPHAMTLRDIRELVEAYRVCATNAAEAGFDGVEVHLGHGHLLQQFLSPLSNVRGDEYGGPLENRLRLALEVLSEIKRAIPAHMILGARISADEFTEGGMNLQDTIGWLPLALAAVSLDYLSVSQSHYVASGSLATQIPDMSFQAGAFLNLPREIKGRFPSLPVLGIGRVETLPVAEQALAAGCADMIGMTRSHIADPYILRKWREGTQSEIRPCLYCNQGCIGQIERQKPLSCVVNPSVGRFQISTPRRRGKEKSVRVLVVGAGPAGLSAATTLAELGATVEIWEQSSTIGGQLELAARLTNRSRLGALTKYYQRAIERLPIHLRLNTRFTWERAEGEQFDHIVLACGSNYTPSRIEGFDVVLSCEQVLSKDLNAFDRIAVIDRDGSHISGTVAETLATLGKKVTLISNLASFLPGVSIYSRYGISDRLSKLGVNVLLGYEIVRGRERTLDLRSTVSSASTALGGIDAIVDTLRSVNHPPLPHSVTRGVTFIGDAFSPRTLFEAVHEGYTAAYELASARGSPEPL